MVLPDTDMEAPLSMFPDVAWSFAEPVPQTPRALIAAVSAYADDIHEEDPSKTLQQNLPFSNVLIRYEYAVRAPNGDWLEQQAEVRVVAAGIARLTVADVLWELHVACASTVGESDKHYFEGFELEEAASGTHPAIYRVVLGS